MAIAFRGQFYFAAEGHSYFAREGQHRLPSGVKHARLFQYHSVLEEAQRIHSVAWYISMITDDYISLDEELQELEKQREFDGNLYTFN